MKGMFELVRISEEAYYPINIKEHFLLRYNILGIKLNAREILQFIHAVYKLDYIYC